ncbi:MAG: AAA family ATPase [Pseudolabrys sp.]|nr:AAA family ATPase [Pseudolabrys sp.]
MTIERKVDFEIDRKMRAIMAQVYGGKTVILREAASAGQIAFFTNNNTAQIRPTLEKNRARDCVAMVPNKGEPGEYPCPNFIELTEHVEEVVPAICANEVAIEREMEKDVAIRVEVIQSSFTGTRNGDAASKPSTSPEQSTMRVDLGRRATLVMVRASDVQPQKIQWLWPNRFAVGKFSLIAGNPGLGKSQLTVHMAAQVTVGGRWPNGEGQASYGSVIILSAEDDAADTLVPRLIAAGADISRVHIVEAIKEPKGTGSLERQFNLADDVQSLCDAIDEIGDVKLVIIDPVTAYLGNGKSVDSHKNAEVRSALAPLQARAAKLGFAAVGVSHLNKGGGSEALMRVLGSLAFVAAARVAFLVVNNTGNERALFIPMKNNIGVKRPGLAFRVVSKTIADGIETSTIEWDHDEVTASADEALAAAAGHEGEKETGQSSVPEAMNFLRDVLTDGAVSAKEVQHRAKEAGITKATLRRAQKALDVKARHRGEGGASGRGEWIWEMPEQIKLRRTDIDD